MVRNRIKSLGLYRLVAAFVGLSISVAAHGYDHQVSNVPVGAIRIFGNYGLEAFTRADGAAFPGCTSDTATMWLDPAFVNADGLKAITAALLFARSTQAMVTVYYTTGDGYCRFQIVQIQ
jgi:hypothetical protein